MTEQSHQPDADAMATDDAPADTVGSNGTHPDTAVGIAEIAGSEVVAADDQPAALDAPAEVADAAPEEPVAEAVETDETPEVEASEADHGDAPLDDGTAFLADLARAMQQTADVERKRIDEDTERRRAAYLEIIGVRRDSGAASIRDLAAADLKAIDDWAQDEHQRINVERKQRATSLQEDLDASLAEHGAKVDAEVESVEAAIAGYRTDVDAYFATMSAATDPVEIAQQAARRPVFPDLVAVSSAEAEAAGDAAPDQPAIAVMDAEIAADPASAWARWNESAAAAEIPEPPTATEPKLQSVGADRPFTLPPGTNEGQ